MDFSDNQGQSHTITEGDTGYSQKYTDIDYREAFDKFEVYLELRLFNGRIHPLDPAFQTYMGKDK